ncbi:MAG: phenylalanine--tRNA ligase subunit alpha [Pyrinomonadaceae bacterium]
MEELNVQVGRITEAFEKEFERFRDLKDSLTLEEAKQLERDLEELNVKYLGKKSEVSSLKRSMGTVPSDQRASVGKLIKDLADDLEKNIWRATGEVGVISILLRTEKERLDVTLPGRRPRVGHLHPITILRQKIEDIFVSMGYSIEDDREIETDHYNFDALNIPAGHPARESQDTFYTTDGFALRSQTSTVQIRAMERRGVPIRIIAPGKVFRRDTPDMTHVPMFHQIEGLCVDKGITMAHLKGTVDEWLKRLFGDDTITRFRPSYFPFTEPSAEFDFSCFKCHGTGKFCAERCRPCKGSGWIELGGSGMVHPNVLKGVGVDPTAYSGFAFGFGLERMAALMYSIDDIRHMFDNDVRFLEQFR